MKNRTSLLLVLLLFFSLHALPQVAINIGGNNPDASSMLDVQSGSKGVLVPRMSASQKDAISNPATGLLIFQSDINPGFYYNSGTPAAPSWTKLGEDGPGVNSKQLFTNPTANFIVPANVHKLYFEAGSAGGGRGGAYTTAGSQVNFGGGGGGGGYVRGYLLVTPGQTITVNVGTAGTNGTAGSGGTAATDGTDGGMTTLYDGATLLCRVTGGGTGFAGSASPGNGGTGGIMNIYNATYCVIAESRQGLAGYPGYSVPVSNGGNDLSGLGGNIQLLGLFNYMAPFNQNILNTNGTGTMYYMAPYWGKGAGKGDVATQGYVYFYW